ncbi:hypothetical protein [Ancylomarina sp. 16SWW S1-10-2]|uniref:hypothetical protein n=1 Tax=Ancylomarina sp. 16SWW S1-10-2 TaxID=2499681 RepID=UPI0012AE9E45|nr:hypothetical protein [Ancylomarina sp. 16SWW S1-10-2]MRT94442.1 hypothetical protein [Ancylomarina sp. 16SWW S1-10-2]
MKRKINRIVVVFLLFGFCISPLILKSQTIQSTSSIFFSLSSDSQPNINNWFSFKYFFDSDWSSIEKETTKTDSLKKTHEIKSKAKRSHDSISPKSKENSLKKLSKTNFRNMPIVIKTRI